MTIKNDKDWENYIKTVKPIKKTGILMPTSLKEKNRFQIEKDEDNDMSLLDILSEKKVNNSEIDKNLLKNIKKGRMKIHAVLDLHGKKVKESKSKVFYFIKNNFEANNRLVLIITGKGKRRGVEEDWGCTSAVWGFVCNPLASCRFLLDSISSPLQKQISVKMLWQALPKSM